jgi:hypothetical protein
MALPSTNRTGHWDASDADNLFTATSLTGAVSDGSVVRGWQDEGDVFDLAFMDQNLGTTVPVWVQSAINGLGAVDFDGSNDVLRLKLDANTGGPTLDTVFNNNAKTLFLVFQMEGAATNNAAIYDNAAILSEDNGYFGLYVKSNGGVHQAIAYNLGSGGEVTVPLTISLDTPYVAMLKQDGSTLYLELRDGGTPLTNSAAATATSNVSGRIHLGRGYAAGFYTGKIAELALFDAALGTTDTNDAWDYFTAKWLAGGASFDPGANAAWHGQTALRPTKKRGMLASGTTRVTQA